MNAKQLATAQTVTSKQWTDWHIGTSYGEFTFVKQMDDEYGVTLFGSNVDNKNWFDKLVCVSIRIGKRGGIKKTIYKH